MNNSKIIKKANTIKKKKMDELFMRKKELILMKLNDTEIKKIIDTQYEIINDEYKENVNKKCNDNMTKKRKDAILFLFKNKTFFEQNNTNPEYIKYIVDKQYDDINKTYSIDITCSNDIDFID